MEPVKNRIRTERRARGMTLKDLADVSGLSESSLSRYERGGDVPASALQRIADAMETEKSVLLDQPDKMPRIAELELRLAHATETIAKLESDIAQKNKEGRRKDRIISVLALAVIAALIALIIDLLNPNVGWIRAAFVSQMGVLM